MKIAALGLGALLVVAAFPVVGAAQQVHLELRNGLATLDATNATPAAILAEWARIGGTRIVDGERVTGGPLTLKLEGVPERQALDIILRSAAGYIAAARPAGSPGVSTFDRILVMPVSVNAAAARSAPAPLAAPMTPAPQVAETANVAEPAADTADVAQQVDDGVAPEQPVSSTEFDYANPQRYFAARAAQQRADAAAAQADDDAGTAGTTSTTGPAGFSTGTLLSRPGTIPTPEAPRQGAGAPNANNPASANPYGLPADAAPGSSTAPPMEPDRSKYINPYAPTPPRPPDQ